MAQNGMNGYVANGSMLAGQFQQINPASHANQHQPQYQFAQQVMHNAAMDPNSFQLMMLELSQQLSQNFVQPAPQQKFGTPSRQSSLTDSDSGLDLKFLDDSFNPQQLRTPSKLNDNMKSLCVLQSIAVRGCDKASQIYHQHSKRPYFKKIDLLCDRLKQDLSVTNKAVVNVNSHGVAWAIKDFIFVFNRIMNAWAIMRDYFYTNSDGMQCVKDSLDPNFAQDFLVWQEATTKLSKSLIQSFENLNTRDQRNGNRRNTSFTNDCSPAYDPFQKIFDPLVEEHSETVQLSGGYLKSAIYKPISSFVESTVPPNTPSDHSVESFKLLIGEVLPENQKRLPNPLYARGSPAQPTSQSKAKVNLTSRFGGQSQDEGGVHPFDDTEEVKKLSLAEMFDFSLLQHRYGNDGAKKIVRIFDDIMTKPESISFTDPEDERNIFSGILPNFIQGQDTTSLTSIINNVGSGKYKTIQDIFIALKMMAEYAKALLQFNQLETDEQKDKIICGFVDIVESSLARHA